MRWEIRDPEYASSLPLWSIKSYLKSHGWVYDGPWGDRGAIHAKELQGGSWEILVPLDDTVSDYPDVTGRIVSELAEAEERSGFDVFSELAATGSDVIRISSTNGYANTALSIAESSELHGNVYDLLGQAARSAEQPKAAYLGRYSDNVRNYLESVVPVNDIASGFALSLHSPVEPRIVEQAGFDDIDYGSFARKATTRLVTALSSTDSIIKHLYAQDRPPDNYNEAIASGVSANFCDCVASLAGSGHGIEIGVHWAPTRRAKADGHPISFSQNTASILHEVANDIRNKQPSYDEYIEGFVLGDVVQLDRKPDEFDGRATIHSVLDGRLTQLSVTFPEHDYLTMVNAFRDHSKISVRGDIHRSGGSLELRNPRDLTPLAEH